MAERVGFEPTLEFPLNTLSKRAPSTTRPSLRGRLKQIGDGIPPPIQFSIRAKPRGGCFKSDRTSRDAIADRLSLALAGAAPLLFPPNTCSGSI